jgi:hypothetical protein
LHPDAYKFSTCRSRIDLSQILDGNGKGSLKEYHSLPNFYLTLPTQLIENFTEGFHRKSQKVFLVLANNLSNDHIPAKVVVLLS